MFPRNLRAFYEAAKVGSIRKASEALNVAPSSISRQIAVLEHEMGTTLFERRAGGVALTHAGELVAQYARSVLVDYDTLRTDLDDVRGTQRRQLRLALVESVVSYGPISAITRFRQQFGSVSFSVRLMPAPLVIDAVLQDRCDIGVAFCADPHPDITTVASVPEPVVVAVPADFPLPPAGEMSLTALSQLQLALPDFDFGVRQILDRASAAAGIRLYPVLSSNVFETLREFVRCGAGAAVLPMRAVAREAQSGTMRILPLAGAPFRDAMIDVVVLRRRRPSKVLKAFVDVLIADIAAAP